MVAEKKSYGYGKWEYRFICYGCGQAVRAPKNEFPCSRCGGDFGPKTSVRKLFLEPEKSAIVKEVEVEVRPTFWDIVRAWFGFHVEKRVQIKKVLEQPPRRYRWQTHTEVEEESGVVRHEDFM